MPRNGASKAPGRRAFIHSPTRKIHQVGWIASDLLMLKNRHKRKRGNETRTRNTSREQDEDEEEIYARINMLMSRYIN
jgi:hypothetical protein